MQQETKSLVTVGLVCLAVFGLGVLFYRSVQQAQGPTIVDAGKLVRDTSHSTASGPGAYKATLVEFGDFQCPACASSHPVLQQLLAQYPSQLNFVFRHFPLSQHKNAVIAAQASEAAADQGKFWQMHDMLYEKQDEWAERSDALEYFVQYAQTLGLDTAPFRKDISDDKFLNRILLDQRDGNALNVNATPTFYLNGEKLTSAPGTPAFEAKLKAILEAPAKPNA